MLVFVTPTCRKSARNFDFEGRLDKVVADLENFDSLTESLQRFDPVGDYLKMPDGRVFRLFGRVVRAGAKKSPIICLLDVYQRKDGRYVEIVNNIKRLGPVRLDPLLDLSDLEDFVDIRLAEGDSDKMELPALPEEFHGWLSAPEMAVDTEVVYESDEWTTRFRMKDVDEVWETFQRMLVEIIQGNKTDPALPQHPALRMAMEKDRFVLYANFTVTQPTQRKVLFLVAPLLTAPTDSDLRHFASILPDPTVAHLSIDDIASRSERSYPAFMLFGDLAWHAIEREKEANLSLSFEEEDVLVSCSRDRVEPGSPLPAFLNGRAGSGKSTMLLYLFADFLDRKLRGMLEGDPLLITYSERLVETARTGVKNILISHARYLAKGEVPKEGRQVKLPSVDKYIQPFHRVLLNLLPPEERETNSAGENRRFAPARYIDFNRFKRLYLRRGDATEEKHYLKLPQAKKYSPELAWHVIRTFIKGRSLELTEPEDYEVDVERRERTVSAATYREIHDTIWNTWYRRLTESDFWDDQDLVRRILDVRPWKPLYTAVFCDEAQDLTRLELRLLLRLSIFSKFDLTRQSVPSLPFCFAGDPFQTLNPTGFRWAALSLALEDEILSVIDPMKTAGLRVNFRELLRNYRSTPPIARAANLVQLWRHVIFQQSELCPQSCWRPDDKFPPPQRFVFGNNLKEEDFRRYARDAILLVPCEHGQEAEFVRRDPVLARMIAIPANGIPMNVFSAMAAKGLEFPRVILYGFGDGIAVSAFEVDPEAEASYDVAYYFNKLYVSVSRPRELLFIVDGSSGDDRLWNHADDAAAVEAIVERARKPDVWRNLVQPIHLGPPGGIQMFPLDPSENAQELEEKGLRLRDAELLDRAAHWWEAAGERRRSRLCAAQALRFLGQHARSGHALTDLGELEEARQCFWEGFCFGDLREWYEKYGESRKAEPEARLAAFMVEERIRADALASFGRKLCQLLPSDTAGRAQQDQWRRGIAEFLNRVGHLEDSKVTGGQWGELGGIVESLHTLGIASRLELAAECFYRAANREKAVLLWEKVGRIQDRRYLTAKADVVGLPAGLSYLIAAEAYQQVVEEWKKCGAPIGPTNRDWIDAVGAALQKLGRGVEACRAYLSIDDTARALETLPMALGEKPPASVQAELFCQLRDRLTRDRRWGDALALVEQPLEESGLNIPERRRIQADLVRELVYNEARPANPDLARWGSVIERVARWSGDAGEEGLSFREIGAAYERAGALQSAAQHYLAAAAKETGPNLTVARDRWVAVRRKQVDAQSVNGAPAYGSDALRARTPPDVVERCSKWELPIEKEIPEQPVLRRQRPKAIRVTGLLSSTPERVGEADVVFRFEHLEIRTYRDKKRIRISDDTQGTNVTVDFGEMRALGEFQDRSNTVPSEHRAFTVPESRYSAEYFVIQDGELTLEFSVGRTQIRVVIPS